MQLITRTAASNKSVANSTCIDQVMSMAYNSLKLLSEENQKDQREVAFNARYEHACHSTMLDCLETETSDCRHETNFSQQHRHFTGRINRLIGKETRKCN